MYRLMCEQGLTLYRHIAVETIQHNGKDVYTVVASDESLDELKRVTARSGIVYLMWREYTALPKI